MNPPEIIEDWNNGRIYEITEGEHRELIGDIDVELLASKDKSVAFITGLSEHEKINNGYLVPASLAVAACLREEFPGIKFFNIENEEI